MDSRFTSGGQCLERPLSTGKQVYQLVEENEKYPVYAPMTKAAAKIQVVHNDLDVILSDIYQ